MLRLLRRHWTRRRRRRAEAQQLARLVILALLIAEDVADDTIAATDAQARYEQHIAHIARSN